jgi:lipoate-protein ligase A
MSRFINTGLRSGKFNMEYDELLATRLAEGKGTPAIRVFGWSPFTISLGFHQNEREIDLRRCEELGIDVVRRPTGGRAILHGHELTYSVVMFAEGRSVLQVYEYISRALVQSLHHLGINAGLCRVTPGSSTPNAVDAISCFASTSKFEIQFQGKKIIGSAQRRYASLLPAGDAVVLQHGSMLLGSTHRDLTGFIPGLTPRARELMQRTFEHRTTEVESILRRKVSFEEAAQAVRLGFERAWDITFDETVEDQPSAGQRIQEGVFSE